MCVDIGSVDTDICTSLYEDLCKAQVALSIQSYLHLIYLITPYDLIDAIKPDWDIMFQMVSHLSSTCYSPK